MSIEYEYLSSVMIYQLRYDDYYHSIYNLNHARKDTN